MVVMVMSEKRFTFDREVEFEIFDNVTKKSYDGTVGCQEKICQLLNEQQATIKQLKEENEQLRKELQKKQEEERLYANEILELREANKEFIQFKELGGDY